MKHRKLYFEDKTTAYIMPKDKSVDVDAMVDFKLAELILRGEI